MINTKSISLLVPCFNSERYINTFLANLLAVNGKFDEVIFYDDGSIDDTYKLLYESGHKILKGDSNMGPGFARNRLAECAGSDYLHFHDIDDSFIPDFLTHFNIQVKKSCPDVIIGQADWIDARSGSLLIAWRYNIDSLAPAPLDYLIKNPVGIINTIYHKNAFNSVGGFHELIKCWEDADIHIKLAAAGFNFSVINAVIAVSNRNNEGISNNQNWCWDCRLQFLEDYLSKYLHRVEPHILQNELKKLS